MHCLVGTQIRFHTSVQIALTAAGTARSKLAAAKEDVGGAMAVIAATQRKDRYLAMLSAVRALHTAKKLPDKLRSALTS